MKIPDIEKEELEEKGFNELVALRDFIANPSEVGWQDVALGEMCDGREKLIREKIPKADWPESFQSADWMIKARREMGMPPMDGNEMTNYLTNHVLVELFTDRERLKVEGVPEYKWPPELQGDDWEGRVWVKHGLEPRRLFRSIGGFIHG